MLTDAGNKATETGEAIALNLTRLLNEIQAQQPSFRGVAGTTLQNVSAELGEELRTLLQALNTMAENVHASNRSYGATDEDAASEISNVAGTYLPGAQPVADALRG
jgi:uncharacterized protein YukE